MKQDFAKKKVIDKFHGWFQVQLVVYFFSVKRDKIIIVCPIRTNLIVVSQKESLIWKRSETWKNDLLIW